MKLITVSRNTSQKDWTLSKFVSDDGSISGVGVEDEFRTMKVQGETRIPADTYNLGLHYPSHFSEEYYRDDFGNLILSKDRKTDELKSKYHTPHEMIWVMNVVGFAYILWHWGNSDLDSSGCYIVGTAFGKVKTKLGDMREGVVQSRAKYVEIYPKIWQAIKAAEKLKTFVQVKYMDAA